MRTWNWALVVLLTRVHSNLSGVAFHMPTPLKSKNEYPVLPLEEETAVQAVVGSDVWAFRRLKKPRCREMSARSYALYSVRPQFSFFSLCIYVYVYVYVNMYMYVYVLYMYA